ncbi:MAG: FtsH protease activity modulator HflK [SAR324 cluster bacterium]|nr:FtsH protease activity modulator HflK [SAR324 cluster bacterium]
MNGNNSNNNNNTNNDDPWKNHGEKPKNIADWVDQGLKRLSEIIKGAGNSGGNSRPPGSSGQGGARKKNLSNKQLFVVIAAVIFGLITYNSVFQIQPGETGVILRFGEHHRNATPGLNFLFPFMEDLKKINIEVVRSIEFKGSSASTNYDNVSTMITADRNVININWVVQYRIKNPENFLFHVVSVTDAIKDISEYVIRRLVGNRDFDYILNQREELAFSAFEEIQSSLDNYESGIELVALQLLDVTPPESVKPAFNEVNEADQDKTRLVNEAQKEANKRIPKARGDALKTVLVADGYAIRRINAAKGDANRFNSIYNQYRKFKKVTRTQLYVSTLKRVLPQVSDVVVIDKKGNLLPLLNLQKSTTSPIN